MTIDNLSDLRALIALCRKTGVETIKVDNVELKLSDYVSKAPRRRGSKQSSAVEGGDMNTADNKIASDSLTREQLLSWSLADDSVSSEE
jgi:hypothetical protein